MIALYLFTENMDMYGPVPCTVELAEKDALPRSQNRAGVFHHEPLGGAHQGGPDMRRGIPLQVPIRHIFRHEPFQGCLNVGPDAGVRAFVDGDGRRGMGDKNQTITVLNPCGVGRLFDVRPDLIRDVDHFGFLGCLDRENHIPP